MFSKGLRRHALGVLGALLHGVGAAMRTLVRRSKTLRIVDEDRLDASPLVPAKSSAARPRDERTR